LVDLEDSITTLSIAGCQLPVKKQKTGFLLKFTPDLFRGRNDKIKVMTFLIWTLLGRGRFY